MTPQQPLIKPFDDLLKVLRSEKPDDRSERDRYFAIVITDVEKARAVAKEHCLDRANLKRSA